MLVNVIRTLDIHACTVLAARWQPLQASLPFLLHQLLRILTLTGWLVRFVPNS